MYLTPLGRRCMYEPTKGHLYFRYLDDPGKLGDGFALSFENFGLLRHAPSR